MAIRNYEHTHKLAGEMPALMKSRSKVNGYSQNKGHAHPVLIFLVLAIAGIIAGVIYLENQRVERIHNAQLSWGPMNTYPKGNPSPLSPGYSGAPVRGATAQVRLFVVSFISVLGVGLVACMLFLFYVDRHNRRVRREIGIPWATNGHGTQAMYSEMNFQQTVLQINSKLTQLEDKAHRLETILMQRAVQGDWNL
jgi:hypothetical protein